MKRSCVIPCKIRRKMNPWPLGLVGRLKGADLGVTLQRQLNFIETLEETRAPARVDLEAMHLSGRRSDRLLLKIDTNTTCALALLDLHCEAINDLLVDDDGQDTVLETVGKKDVAE